MKPLVVPLQVIVCPIRACKHDMGALLSKEHPPPLIGRLVRCSALLIGALSQNYGTIKTFIGVDLVGSLWEVCGS